MRILNAKLLLSLLALLLVFIAWQGGVDEFGRQYTEEGFRRALITFGVARALNGVISVAQGTEVAVEPVGIGLTFTPGEILDPVNDLVERFSWVVLASGTSLGIQRVLLQVVAWPWFTVITGSLVAVALLLLWWRRPVAPYLKRICYPLAIILLILRFSIPMIAIANEGLYRFFLAPQYSESQLQLEQTAQTLSQLNRETRSTLPEEKELSLLESARRMYETAASGMQIESRIETFKQSVENVSEHAIQLIVVFVLQTILFPLLFLWLVIQLLKWVAGMSFGT